jgi:A/G-specific adenine glycosylase
LISDSSLNERLLDWYVPRRHAYPWRTSRRDPYSVLVSEMMLQQTQAPRVAPLFLAFIERFPTVADLAESSKGEVVRAWAGLGYNRRAIALSDGARMIVSEHGGRVPREVVDLRRLPGVGPYTAAAVASIAFRAPVPAIDTNVARIVARVRLGAEPSEVGSAGIGSMAEAWIDRAAPGEWNQALMDLGRQVCRSTPRCHECPIAAGCRFLRDDRHPSPRRRPQSRFEGSQRQVRGAVVRELRSGGTVSLAGLASRTGHPPDRVAAAVASLASEGLVVAGPAALKARPSGRVRLPET